LPESCDGSDRPPTGAAEDSFRGNRNLLPNFDLAIDLQQYFFEYIQPNWELRALRRAFDDLINCQAFETATVFNRFARNFSPYFRRELFPSPWDKRRG
jgi:hypothetical protein